jgi:ribonuclease BN (tRNA processing enzyme)
MLDKPRLLIEQPALNFIIERDGCTLFYGLDSSYLLPETLETLAGFDFDVLVLDATFGNQAINPAQSGHMNFEMVVDTVTEMRSIGAVTNRTEVIASHISLAAVPPHDDIVDDLKRRDIILAFDGMRWTP